MSDIYRFGRFELDAERLTLRRGGELLTVEHKPLEVLIELLRSAGDLVTKNDLMESVWAGRVVTESVISSCVKKLRAALGDDGQTLILTVHGYGYRFTGGVDRNPPEHPAAEGGEEPHSRGGFKAGDCPPLRPHWRLRHPLDDRGGIWLAEHDKTAEKRAFKFALDAATVGALKRELTIHRLLQSTLGNRRDLARLLDYNLEAQPYFLELEYCSHGSLVDWLEAQGGGARVPMETRLELMALAAEALAAAHAVGVLHLDIKPSNLLIWMAQDDTPRIRWTDFGSGRMLEPGRLKEFNITRLDMTETPLEVEAATLLYCPPEVIGGQAPTALSDIYALGVMLYQVVCGNLRRPMAPGWEQDIADEVLRGDIAAAAAGNPDDRISSAAELGRRLRSLAARRAELETQRLAAAHAAILTRRLNRMRARRPWLIAAGLALTLGLSFSWWNYRAAVQARDEARNQAMVAEGVSLFLSHDVLGSSSAYDPAVRKDVTVLQALDRAAAHLDGPNKLQPLIEATVRYSLAYAYTQMAARPEAEKQARKAADLYSGQLGPGNVRTVQAIYLWLENLVFDSRFADAEREFDAMDQAPPQDADADTRLLHDVLRGANDYYWERYAPAATYYEKALDQHNRLHPQDLAGLAIREQMLGLTYLHLGRMTDANRLLQQAIDQTAVAPEHDEVAIALAQEANGIALYLQGQYAAAEKVLPRAHEVLVREVGADEQESAESLEYLGQIYLKTGRAAEAEQASRSSYQSYLARYGSGNVVVMIARGHLGMAEVGAGHVAEGLQDLRKAQAALAQLLGPAAPHTQYFQFQLALDLLRNGAKAGDVATLVDTLDTDALQAAAPGEQLSNQLAQLKGQLTLARDH